MSSAARLWRFTLMPNSKRCVPACLCIDLYIVEGSGNRQLIRCNSILSAPNAGSGVTDDVLSAAAAASRITPLGSPRPAREASSRCPRG
jgi:hypothetical protein